MSETSTYNRILKSTAIIGGSSVINILFKIIQSKFAALILGPSGIGLLGLFNSVVGLGNTIIGMGLPTSGVREIAHVTANQSPEQIADSVAIFKQTAYFLGLFGSILFFVFRDYISFATFGNKDQSNAIGVLSIVIFFSIIANVQSSILRGMSKIGDIARIAIFNVAISTLIGIPILYFWKNDGIIPFLILGSISNLFFSWFYYRKIVFGRSILPIKSILHKSKGLVSLGFWFMFSSLAATSSAYLLKIIITRTLGLDSLGLFEASTTLSNVYVGFILGAMGTDFFPHLSALSEDNPKSTELINSQVNVGLLLATPGMLAILAIGPSLIKLLYSSQFLIAFDVLRWQVLGTFLRVISWPAGYLILSRGKIKSLLFLEFSTNAIYLIFAWVGIVQFGLPGIGIAFFIMYIYHVIVSTLLAKRIIDFHWTKSSQKNLALLFCVIIFAFGISLFNFQIWGTIIGLILSTAVAYYSMITISKLSGFDNINSFISTIKSKVS